jgi:hypothetical protein
LICVQVDLLVVEGRLRCLTFDMGGGRRRGSLAARCSMDRSASRPRCLAGGRPLDGRVRRHYAASSCAC